MPQEIHDIRDLTDSEFLDFVRSEQMSVIVFASKSCSACEAFAAGFRQASRQFSDAQFGRVNVEVQRSLAEKLEISYLPTLMIVREGTLVFRQPGKFSPGELAEVIEHARSMDLDDLRAKVRDESGGQAA